MIPLADQLAFAKQMLSALKSEVPRYRGEAREQRLKEVEVQTAIVSTLEKLKFINEVADETEKNPPKAWKEELNLA